MQRKLMTVAQIRRWKTTEERERGYDMIRYRDRLEHGPAMKRTLAARIALRGAVIDALNRVLGVGGKGDR